MKSANTAKKQRKPQVSRSVAVNSTGARPADSPLTSRQITRLRRSFAQVQKKAGIAALMFYRHLFTLDPSLRKLFHSDIEIQGRKLMDALAFVMKSLEKPDELEPILEAMGRRHTTYGVRDEHYDIVIRAFILALEESLGGRFDTESACAWRLALENVAAVMKIGAASIGAHSAFANQKIEMVSHSIDRGRKIN